MAYGITEYLKNMDFFDYLGMLTAIVSIIAFLSGSIYTIFNYLFHKPGKVEIPDEINSEFFHL